MIKICQQQSAHRSAVFNEKSATNNNLANPETMGLIQERFRNFVSRVTLSEDGLLATYLGTCRDGSNSSVYCTHHYSSGRHEIHFRIENKGNNNLFFGIKTISYDIPVQTLTSSHAYG